MKNFYEILEISPNASQAEIKRQYRFLLHAWHPDKFSDAEFKKKAEEKTRNLNEAYSLLSNPQKRRAYDISINNQTYKNQPRESQQNRERATERARKRAEEDRNKQSWAEAEKKRAAKETRERTAEKERVRQSGMEAERRRAVEEARKRAEEAAQRRAAEEERYRAEQGKKRALVITIIGITILLVVVILGNIVPQKQSSISENTAHLNSPTFSLTPRYTMTSTILKPTTTPGSGDEIFYDDYSDINSGWVTKNIDMGTTGYASGTYRIIVTNPYSMISAKPPIRLPNDVRIEVDAQPVDTPRNSFLGIACRYKDKDTYYVLIITNNGYAAIGKTENDVLSLFHGFIPISDINQENSHNHLRADCIGNKLTLYVNGKFALTEVDDSFSEGSVGLIAGNTGEVGIEAIFDNFYVYTP